jgi:gluconate 2-dehydrogenase subunit 3-like protein
MLTRRTFLGWLATAVPAVIVVRRAHAAAIRYLRADPRTLQALGETVLPAAMGQAALRAEVDAFQKWMDGYRENVEITHGYGTSRLRTTGPTPATRWVKQLDDLDARARAANQQSFADLAPAQRVEMVKAALANERLDRMPAVGDANHVAVALPAHYYASPAATDLCYEAQIGKNLCRPLADQSRKPLPLARPS